MERLLPATSDLASYTVIAYYKVSNGTLNPAQFNHSIYISLKLK